MCVAEVDSVVVRVNNVNGRLEPNINPDMLPGLMGNRTPPWRQHQGKWHLPKVDTPLGFHLNQVEFLDTSTL